MSEHREFEPDFLALYMREPFLGAISMAVTKEIDRNVPTAYVTFRGSTNELIMGYNPDFFRKLTPNERMGVIKHELYHIIFGHLYEMPKDKFLWNVATDLAINSIIGKDNLPSSALVPGHRPIDATTKTPVQGDLADFIEQATPLQSAQYYFNELQKLELEKNEADGFNTLDNHDRWEQSESQTSPTSSELARKLKDKIERIVGKAAKQAQKANSWGTVPNAIRDVILANISSKEIDWRAILRYFVGCARSSERQSTIKRLNKKQPYIYPGFKRTRVANFACFIDQSGSMFNSDIKQLFSEIEQLAHIVPAIDVFNFDTEVDQANKVTWKKGAPKIRRRTRAGGTNFQSIVDFCNSNQNIGKWSGVIILTDGHADPPKNKIKNARTLWVVTSNGTDRFIRSTGDLIINLKKEK